MNQVPKLIEIVNEAELLLSKHDGVHDMHGAKAGIKAWLESSRDLSNYQPCMENVDYLIRAMRFCDIHGFYPSSYKKQIEKREINSWDKVGV